MKKRFLNGKKIVYWGIGEVCRNCLRSDAKHLPDFFIDSFSAVLQFEGKNVIKPQDIYNWGELFVVIAVDNYFPIERELLDRGLKRGTDFEHYLEFFKKEKLTIEKISSKLKKYKNEVVQGKNILLMFMCMFIGRQSSSLQNFFREYIKIKSKTCEVAVVVNLGAYSEERASDILGCKVFDDPFQVLESEKMEKARNALSQEEECLLQSVFSRKNGMDNENAVLHGKNRYIVIREYLDIIQPAELMIWHGWELNSYLLQEMAVARKIPYRVLEHGSIPGTVQADPKGIMGQSIYGKTQDVLKNVEIPSDYEAQFEKIRSCIIKGKLDTRVFHEVDADQCQLRKLKKDRKTVFLVGMDEKGMSINPKGDYWVQYVSGTHYSMQEVLEDLIELCRRHKLNLIYKPHPGNVIEERFLSDANFVYVQETNIDDLIVMSDVVVSMSSAVEYKVLLYEKALMQVGYSSLWQKDCSYCLEDRKEFERVLNAALENSMTDKQKYNFKVFLMKLLNSYFWDDLTDRVISYGLTFDRDFFI